MHRHIRFRRTRANFSFAATLPRCSPERPGRRPQSTQRGEGRRAAVSGRTTSQASPGPRRFAGPGRIQVQRNSARLIRVSRHLVGPVTAKVCKLAIARRPAGSLASTSRYLAYLTPEAGLLASSPTSYGPGTATVILHGHFAQLRGHSGQKSDIVIIARLVGAAVLAPYTRAGGFPLGVIGWR